MAFMFMPSHYAPFQLFLRFWNVQTVAKKELSEIYMFQLFLRFWVFGCKFLKRGLL
jgi:hypothetical protein